MRVLGHHLYFPILVLLAIEFAGAGLAFMAGAWLTAPSADGFAAVGVLPASLGFGAAVIVGLTSVGLYQPKQRLTAEGVLVRIGVALGLAAVFLSVFNLFFSAGVGGALWALSFAISLSVLALTRLIFARFVGNDAFGRRVLVFGAGQRAARLLKLRRRSDRRGFSIVGFVPSEGDNEVVRDERVRRAEGSLTAYAQEQRVDEIVIAMDDRRRGFPVAELLECRFNGIAVVDLVSFLERETGRVAVDLVEPSWLIFSDGFNTNMQTRFGTRAFDVTVAAAMFVVALPVMVCAAVAVVVDDGWPILYRQKRVGQMGRAFDVLKFRSMIKNAEADGKAQWAKTGDQRITRVGATLRKLRIDELPQLINVLRGDMSIVGPRPERPEFVERLARTIPYYHERHVVKPGITGWAQLSYPYGSSDDDALAKLQYDLYYIKHKGLIFDLIVMLQTAEVVLWGKGAR